MAREIIIKCCEGNESYEGQCLMDRCPLYRQAETKVRAKWPRLATGFGNAYGEPRHGAFLEQVIKDIKDEAKKVE